MGSENGTRHLSWGEVRDAAKRCAARNAMFVGETFEAVWGVPRGGVPAALLVAEYLGVPMADDPGPRTLVIDDLIDSGRTAERVAAVSPFDALYRKPHSPERVAAEAVEVDAWLVFPWEVLEVAGPEDAVVRLLEFIGEDPTREGLADTPRRVVNALAEMTSGLRLDPASVLGTTFEGEGYDEMVVMRGIDFTSLCEHHLLPFVGTVDVGYIPNGRIVGFSKLARLVEVFALRPQVQERMTTQIAQTLESVLAPLGVGVVVKAKHACMGCRGVRKPAAEAVTSCLIGYMRVSDAARREFLGLSGHDG